MNVFEWTVVGLCGLITAYSVFDYRRRKRRLEERAELVYDWRNPVTKHTHGECYAFALGYHVGIVDANQPHKEDSPVAE